MASKVSNELARDKNWKKLESYVNSLENQIMNANNDTHCEFVSSQLSSAFSSACRYNAPLYLVKAIYKTICNVFGEKWATSLRTNGIDGTALHEAMAKSEISVIDFLLSVAAKEVFVVQDLDGQVPLHILVRRVFTSIVSDHSELLRVMKETLEKEPRASMIADRNLYEENPLVLALKSHFYYDFGDDSLSASKQQELLESATHNIASLILEAYPKSASSLSPRGYTPLHSVLYHGRSLALVKDIMIRFKENCLIRNGSGEVPLHFAAMRFDNIQTFEVLLHCVPQCARCQDALNLTPLHWTFIRYLTLSDFQQRHHQQRPLDYTGFRFLPRDYLDLVKQFDNAILQRSSEKYKRPRVYMIPGDFAGFWKRMKAILRAVHVFDDKRRINADQLDDDSFLLHSSCMIACPESIPKMLNCFDREAVRRRDPLGRIPLHYACERNDNFWKIEVGEVEGSQHIDIRENTAELVSFIVSNFKEGARISDANNRLPLHQALDSQNINSCVINTLITNFPSSVNMRDGVTKLFPFMLAAVSKVHRSQSPANCQKIGLKEGGVMSELQDKCELDIVFYLLQLSPDLVKSTAALSVPNSVVKRRRCV